MKIFNVRTMAILVQEKLCIDWGGVHKGDEVGSSDFIEKGEMELEWK